MRAHRPLMQSAPVASYSLTDQASWTQVTATGAAGSQETALRELALPGLTARPDQNQQRGEIFGFPGSFQGSFGRKRF